MNQLNSKSQRKGRGKLMKNKTALSEELLYLGNNLENYSEFKH
jgi:hypothetical protein